jgi:hypothetical protein
LTKIWIKKRMSVELKQKEKISTKRE